MKNNFKEFVGVEEALDSDAVAVVPVLDAAIVQLGLFDFAERFESLGGTDAMESGRSGERQRDGYRTFVGRKQNKTRETTHNRRNPNRQNSTLVLSSVN